MRKLGVNLLMCCSLLLYGCSSKKFDRIPDMPVSIDLKKLENLKKQKERVIVLTDINTDLKQAKEQDDVQSLIRLLTYSNEIDIEGIIATTSCWLKKGARENNLKDINNVIDAYEKVKPNLDIHAQDYPTADYLRSISCCGIEDYGEKEGKGFANAKYNNNKGVKLILDAIDKDDDRPLWISAWDGTNTLAQAIWQVKEERSDIEFNKFLSKIRVYAIFDQDGSGKWLRDNFGDKLYYIVTPTPLGNGRYYDYSTSAAISTKKDGANNDVISNQWIKDNIQSKGVLGKVYPDVAYIEEGDSPSFMHLIQNGLNIPSHVEYGSWGGRWIYRMSEDGEFKTKEKNKFYTHAADTIIGVDNKTYKGNEETLFRWREDFQNDFANRLDWSITNDYSNANHAPVIENQLNCILANKSETLTIQVKATSANNSQLKYDWIYYKEVGDYNKNITFNCDNNKCSFVVPNDSEGKTFSFVCKVTSVGKYPVVSYSRFFIAVK